MSSFKITPTNLHNMAWLNGGPDELNQDDDYYSHIDFDQPLYDDWDRHCEKEDEKLRQEQHEEEEYKMQIQREREAWLGRHGEQKYNKAALVIQQLWKDWLDYQVEMAYYNMDDRYYDY